MTKEFQVLVCINAGNDFEEGEYTVEIVKLINRSTVEEDDWRLINECIYEDLDRNLLNSHGDIRIFLNVVSYMERMDVFYDIYYKIKKIHLAFYLNELSNKWEVIK